MRSEFELIDRYFRDLGARRADVRIGVGDDGAVLHVPPDCELVAVADTLVEGRHFPVGCAPRSIGHRALAVNLSDLAAMGATPCWALLALTMPTNNDDWLREFALGFGELARRHQVALVGGDTTAGPLCVTVQAMGFVPRGAALLRSGGRPGDQVFVSGTPGDAAYGLSLELSPDSDSGANDAELRARFLFPEPRLELGRRLAGFASACIDISDGLGGDLGKLAAASGCAARIDVERLPLSNALRRAAGSLQAQQFALTGGDDYELCFTVPAAKVPQMLRALPTTGLGYTGIGELFAGAGVELCDRGVYSAFSGRGFDHFAR